jgi:hypothetical protein
MGHPVYDPTSFTLQTVSVFKAKGTVIFPCTCHEGVWENEGVAPLILTSAPGSGQLPHSRSANLFRRKHLQYPLIRDNRFGRCRGENVSYRLRESNHYLSVA